MDAVARLREDVAKKRSELLQKRMSENHDLQSKEEIRDLYDLAVLDAGLGEGDGEDIQIVKDFFELRVKKAEDLGSLFKEIKLVDELFANGASGSEILEIGDERAVELLMERIRDVENAAGCRGLESLVDAFPFKDAVLKDQMLNRIRERSIELGS
ncbi:MAG: hypothetical protein HGA16_03320 [Candidatus Moranbacteria bacterium]|nr:hypothetical protein [Candidatus Moranbacteria bacterium]